MRLHILEYGPWYQRSMHNDVILYYRKLFFCSHITKVKKKDLQPRNIIVIIMDCEIYGDSISDSPPEPICFICWVDIGAIDWLGMPKEFQRLPEDERHWKELWKPGPEHLMVSSSEAENICLDRFSSAVGLSLPNKYVR